jgi:hypothetical protein
LPIQPNTGEFAFRLSPSFLCHPLILRSRKRVKTIVELLIDTPLGVVEGGFVGDRTEAQTSDDAESRIGKGVKHSQSPPQQPGLVVLQAELEKMG